MEYVTLNNGVKMPILGFGVYQIENLKECEQAVSEAIQTGYRLIDTAQAYFNEEAVGNAVKKSGLPRQDFFLVTKVWISNDGYEKAKEISAWKEKMAQSWDAIEVVSMDLPEKLIHNPQVGEDYNINVVIDMKQAVEKGIGIELLAIKTDTNNQQFIADIDELTLVKTEGTKLFFNINYQLDNAGAYKYGFRMFPKNDMLPHRQDFCYVRWM